MRTLAWILAVPLLLVIALVLLLPMLVSREALLSYAVGRIEAGTGAQLRVGGEPSLAFFPGAALSMPELTLTTPDGRTQVTVASAEAGMPWLPLLSGRIEIDRLLLRGVTVTSSVSEAEAKAEQASALDTARLNRAELDAYYAARRAAGSTAPTAGAALALPFALDVGTLRIEDATLRTVSEAGEELSRLTVEQFSAEDINSAGRAVPVKARLVLGTTEEGRLEIGISASLVTAPATRSIALEAFEATVGSALEEPLTVSARGTIGLSGPVAKLDVIIAGTEGRGKGSLQYDPGTSPAIDAHFHFDRLTSRLLAIVAADPGAAGPPRSDDATTTLPLNLLRSLDTRARLEADEAEFGDLSLAELKAELRIVEGVATLAPARARLYGGSLEFSGTLDAHYNDVTLESEGGLEGLQLGSALRQLGSPVAARGSARLLWELDSGGISGEALLENLRGPLTLETENAVLEQVGLERELCRALATARQASLQRSFPRETPIETLAAQLRFGDGFATLDSLELVTESATLDGEGRLALLSGDLQAAFGARLGDDFGAGDPACALEGELAELRWPVRCEGNLAGDPARWCSIDLERVVRDLAQDQLREKARRKAGKLLDRLLEQ